MIKIRRNVFETNSSSSHSISIRKDYPDSCKELTIDDIYIDNGKLNMCYYDLDFGRSPFEPLTTFFDKCRYAIASFAYDDNYRKEVEDVMFEVIPALKKIVYDKDHHSQGYYYGDIDHQSQDVLINFLNKHQLSIRDFLTDPKYVIFIDGDEYNIKQKMLNSGLLHKEDFIEHYPTEE